MGVFCPNDVFLLRQGNSSNWTNDLEKEEDEFPGLSNDKGYSVERSADSREEAIGAILRIGCPDAVPGLVRFLYGVEKEELKPEVVMDRNPLTGRPQLFRNTAKDRALASWAPRIRKSLDLSVTVFDREAPTRIVEWRVGRSADAVEGVSMDACGCGCGCGCACG